MLTEITGVIGGLLVGAWIGRFLAPPRVVTKEVVRWRDWVQEVRVPIKHEPIGVGGSGVCYITCTCGCPHKVRRDI